MDRRKLLIADDSELNRAILVNVLEDDFDVLEVSDGREAVAAIQAHRGELAALLLDVVMPEMDGFAVLERMGQEGWLEELPTIMISAETSGSFIDRAFQLGAADYVSRPFMPSVIRRRIMNTILLHDKKQQLMGIVADKFCRREKNDDILVSILSYAVEYRDGDGGEHMSGVTHVTGLLLRRLLEKTDKYPLNEEDVESITMAAGLHDIGKLLISGDILTKPGRLTEDEFNIIRRHTQIGAKMITELPVYQNEQLVKYAIEICRWHHERWHGEGYPDGRMGDEIPIAAQVVALADVYSALTSKRSYKEAYSHEKAIKMIDHGECGSFNPLLLECLHELGDALKEETPAAGTIDRGRKVMREVVEDLYQGRDVSAARMAQQLEEENAKRHFFSELTAEPWFEYTTHPAALNFSSEAARLTGLPMVLVDPLASSELRAVVPDDAMEKIRQWLDRGDPDQTYLEVETELDLADGPCWCQLALQVFWSSTEPGHCGSILGKIRDIDANYRRLEQFDRALETKSDVPALLLASIGGDGLLRIRGDQVEALLRGCRQMYAVARLVDPEVCMQVVLDADGHEIQKSEHCYGVWDRAERCERCISRDVVRNKKPQTKIEALDNEVFYVLAVCVEVDGVRYSLELVNPIHIGDVLDDNDDGSILNQLLVRNRQVYIDSLTKVYNRRYYDDQLKGLNGSYAVAMIDMDNFKHINDCFGHQAGDAALYRTAQAIKSQTRSSDKLVRYGGDEFFLLLRDMPAEALERKLQNIRDAVDAIEIPEYPGLKISVSIGGAHLMGELAENMGRADEALYEAKTKKDCVKLYQGGEA